MEHKRKRGGISFVIIPSSLLLQKVFCKSTPIAQLWHNFTFDSICSAMHLQRIETVVFDLLTNILLYYYKQTV